jgi:choline dehydrogenase
MAESEKAPETCEWDGCYDYVVVGSGAGGGVVAANLAIAGYTVALLEAGGADTPSTYEVPAFFAETSEDRLLRWDYVVHHYNNKVQESRDSKITPGEEGGIWYPRAGTLGGCTAHNALITICGHDSDWNRIAELTGDESWKAENMYQYFERLERCMYARRMRFGRQHPGRHGFSGWLTTNVARPRLLAMDWKVMRIVWASLLESLRLASWTSWKATIASWWRSPGKLYGFWVGFLDPNDMRRASFEREGVFYVPFSTEGGRRAGVRDLIEIAQQDHPDKLDVLLHTLVTKIVFEDNSDPPKAIGVEYRSGRSLYRADPKSRDWCTRKYTCGRIRARHEVILAAGAFNSPQILMLSGIGDPSELQKHSIEPLQHMRPAPGVGKNLQDRYEVGVVSKTKTDFRITRGATFRRPGAGERPDPQFAQWLKGKGPYATNGILVCITKRSRPDLPEPDLFMISVPGIFAGYKLGYTQDIARNKAHFTWLILKAHTKNRAGTVTLRSADPQDTPCISFRYFDEGSPGWEDDLDAVVDGIEFVRRINNRVRGLVEAELTPGDRDLHKFVRDEAWGHHACGTNPMGRSCNSEAVVDSKFKVIGTSGLRIVDASIFPRIPGFFVAAPIYMIAEKATDDILRDIERQQQSRRQQPPGQTAKSNGEHTDDAWIMRSKAAIVQTMNKRYNCSGKAFRGDHGKTHGCLFGTFEVLPTGDPSLNVGVAAIKNEMRPPKYRVEARFSNSGPPEDKDYKSFALGLALKIYLDKEICGKKTDFSCDDFLEGSEPFVQDFVMASDGADFINSRVCDYAETLEARAYNFFGKARFLFKKPLIVWRTRPYRFPPQSVMNEQYFSKLPFKWGANMAKYKIWPCELQLHQKVGLLEFFRPDYQTAFIKDALQVQDLSFCFGVQLRPQDPPDGKFPIDDATVEWDEKIAPYRQVAKITFKYSDNRDFDSAIKHGQAERRAFSPWNCLRAHEPLGSLNQARRIVYDASKDFRQRKYASGAELP